jgi:rhamnulokinase
MSAASGASRAKDEHREAAVRAAEDQVAEAPEDRRALVAIDLGAESCRVSLLRWIEGQPRIELVHRFANAPVFSDASAGGDGRLYWDLGRIEAGLYDGLELCAELAPEGIRSLAVDGWAVDYVRLDGSGAAVANPFCYRDERTVAAERAVHARMTAEAMRAITGVQILRINTVYQLFADEEEVKRLRWLNLPEYVLHRLGGLPVAELTNATHTQMVGLADRDWSEEIVDALGFSAECFPPIVAPGTDVGKLHGPLTKYAAFRQTRLIAPACHDTASAIAGIPDSGDDWAYISSGTWSLVGTVLDEAVNDAAARAENFTNLGAAGGRVCFHKNVNGMWLLRQCMASWATEKEFTVPELIAMAEAMPQPEFLLVVDEAELLLPGEMPVRINAQLRRRRLPEFKRGAEDAAAITALLFHSLAARYAEVLGKIEAITGKLLRRVYVVGGGSRNALLNRLTATATGLEVVAGSAESSTMGNFAVQLAAGEGTPASAGAIGRWARVLFSARTA